MIRTVIFASKTTNKMIFLNCDKSNKKMNHN